MCGIVGAVSSRNIVPVLVQGLQRLEYRGYDSCGVAVHAASLGGHSGGLQRARSTARVAELMAQVQTEHIEGGTGIAIDPATLRESWHAVVTRVLSEATVTMPSDGWMHAGGREGKHSEHLGVMLAEFQSLARTHPGATW